MRLWRGSGGMLCIPVDDHARNAGTSNLKSSLKNSIDLFFHKSGPSYLLIATLQLKILWNIWRYKDLTTGDTSGYFLTAAQWAERWTHQIHWSPLYTSFYGLMIYITDDVYIATILHRCIIVMAVTLGVLALMRKIIPPGYALLIAIWWAILPINFDTLYEVHLFAVLPVLVALLIAASWSTRASRGFVLAVLIAATVLVRNELIIAVIVFGLGCLAWEIRTLNLEPQPTWLAWRRSPWDMDCRYFWLSWSAASFIRLRILSTRSYMKRAK